MIEENALGDSIYDFARSEGLDDLSLFTTTLQSKEEIYQLLRRQFEVGALSLPDDDDLIDEVTSLQFDFSSTGRLRVHAPDGEHDDRVDALAFAVHALDRAQSGGAQRTSRDGSKPSVRSRRR